MEIAEPFQMEHCQMLKKLMGICGVCGRQKFWDWSFDEQAAIDLPALLGYIYNSSHNKVYYVGHSQVHELHILFFHITKSISRRHFLLSSNEAFRLCTLSVYVQMCPVVIMLSKLEVCKRR